MIPASTLMIEAEGQPTVSVTIEAVPDIIFRDSGVQGPPGSAAIAGDGIKVVGEVVNIDIPSLTFAP